MNAAKQELGRIHRAAAHNKSEARAALVSKIDRLRRYAQEASDALDRGCSASSFECIASNIAAIAISIQRSAAEMEQASRFCEQLENVADFLAESAS